ncbi:hypothetical protein FLAVO9AF_230020 [Flavobacterium sp. 9AF]|nr:hypothetical protein FLAVO9AF_230020 [Flavobacterium sp. 9AF]
MQLAEENRVKINISGINFMIKKPSDYDLKT